VQTTTTEPATGELDASRLTHLVGYAASRAAIEMRKVFTHHMAALDLKIVDFSILMLVAANPEVNQKRIGQALDISAPNMAVTLDRLVERGWVQRVRSDKDRRAQHIHLTAGRIVSERLRPWDLIGAHNHRVGRISPLRDMHVDPGRITYQ